MRKGITPKAKSPKPKKTLVYKYFIDCRIPVADGILNLDHFEKYMTEKFTAKAKTDKTAKDVGFFKKDDKLNVHAKSKLSKQYVKYLTKKYLKKQELRDWLRLLSTGNKGLNRGYQMKYFNVNREDEGAEEAENQEKKE